MKRITVTDTLELSIPERIQLVEDIWDTIAEMTGDFLYTAHPVRLGKPLSQLFAIHSIKCIVQPSCI